MRRAAAAAAAKAAAARLEGSRLGRETDANGRLLRGDCYCRAVGYAVEDTFEYALNCHCSDCRRTTGSAFKPFAGLPAGRLSVIRGAADIMRFGKATNHNAHCRHCGSLLYSLTRDGAYAHVAMGNLLDAPSIRPTAHIFVGSKAPWYTITDDLPQHAEFPPT